MRKMFVWGIISAMTLVAPAALLAAPASVSGQAQQFGSITGAAKDADGKSLSTIKVRVRSVNDGSVLSEVKSDGNGTFSVTGLPPGNYVVEVLGPNGAVIGVSPAVTVAAGASAAVTVTAAAPSNKRGAGLFGLGTATTVALVGAAAVSGVVAVKATQNDASPSR